MHTRTYVKLSHITWYKQIYDNKDFTSFESISFVEMYM